MVNRSSIETQCFAMVKNSRVNIRGLSVRALLLLGLAGCSSVPATVAVPTLNIPEVGGHKWRLTLDVRDNPAYSVDVVNSASGRPPDLTIPSTENGTPVAQVGSDVGVTLGERYLLQAGLITGGPSGTSVGATTRFQVQFLGDTYEDSGPGNFSMLAALEGQSVSNSANGNQAVTFGAGGYPWQMTSTSTMALLSLSMGYRFTNHMLWFWGGGVGTGTVTGQISQQASSDGTSPAASYTVQRAVQTAMLGSGLDFSTRNHHFAPKVMVNALQYNSNQRTDAMAVFEWRYDMNWGRASKFDQQQEVPAPAADGGTPQAFSIRSSRP